jgi:hypothetical protein
MSESDFNKVMIMLKEEGSIEIEKGSIFYNINGYSMYLKQVFKSNKLKEISLYGSLVSAGFSIDDGMTPYRIFKEKYNLPDLIKKDKYYQRNTIPNKDYNLVNTVYLDNNTGEIVPTVLTQSTESNYKYYTLNKNSAVRMGLVDSELTANKNIEVKIIFKEVPSKTTKNGKHIVYQLEDWEYGIPLKIKDKYGIGVDQVNFLSDGYKSFNDQKEMETLGNYLIRKNSKYLTEYSYQNFDLEVTYMTNEYFIEKQSQINKSEIDRIEIRKKIRQAEENDAKIKKKESLEEI